MANSLTATKNHNSESYEEQQPKGEHLKVHLLPFGD